MLVRKPCGTQFKVVPKTFYQCLDLHCYIGEAYTPRLWVLMPNKKLESYDRVWRAIKEIGLRHDKRRIPEAEKGFQPRRILLGREEKLQWTIFFCFFAHFFR